MSFTNLEPNTPIAIEQVQGGFLVRTLGDAKNRAIDAMRATVIPTLGQLEKAIDKHFRATTCPQCGATCDRTTMWYFMSNAVVVRCRNCKIMNVEGYPGDWLSCETNSVVCREEMDRRASKV